MCSKSQVISAGLCAVLLGALTLFAASCGDATDGSSSLMRTSDVAAGEDCANGGTQFDAGVDQNGNGVLDDSEITSTSLVCNGASGEDGEDGNDGSNGANGQNGLDGEDGADGINTLSRMTILDEYDENCPYGGLQIDSGGDTDGDGVLDDDEIEATEYVCNGQPAFFPEDTTAPEGPAGVFTINLTGGVGSTAGDDSGSGGHGGDFDATINYGSLGGHIKLFNTGLADASFDFPASVPTYLGSNPLEVTEDLTIVAVDDSHTGLGGAVYHTHFNANFSENDDNYSTIWERDGSSDVAVTGVSVAAGRTLTFEVNRERLSVSTQEDAAAIRLVNDFHNAGTLTVEEIDPTEGPNFTGSLFIDCDVFHGEAGSAIDLSGSDAAAGTDGSHGGHLLISAEDNDWPTSESAGAVFNQGTITTSGGSGDTGGNAGVVYLSGNLVINNTGDITALGGVGTNGAGGNGPYWIQEDYDDRPEWIREQNTPGNEDGVSCNSEYGHNFNSGNIDTSGGAGTTSGGDGGEIDLYIGFPGHLLNSGDLTAIGGAATDIACLSECDGGDGGDIDFYVYGGDIINSGDLTSTGGMSVDANGGDGGNISVGSDEDDGWYGDYQPVGSFMFSGDIDTSGGDGASGGIAGYLDFDLQADEVPDNQEIILLGYTSITTNGGAGATDGGDAGDVFIENEYSFEYEYVYLPSGGIVNHVAITAMGGEGDDGDGGDGGHIEMLTDDEYGYATEAEFVMNYGALVTTGGDGTTDGGDGGYVMLWGYNHVENGGDINASGGNASAVGGDGGFAAVGGEGDDGVFLLSDLGPVINSGDITAAGGSAKAQNGTGGNGELVELVGYSVDNSGNFSVAGGDGGETGVDADGGAANIVFLYGLFEGTQNTATSIDLTGGEGNTNDGADGECFIDTVNDTASWL